MEFRVSLDQAAKELDARLRRHPWYLSTGVGQTANGDALFVYVKSKNHPELKSIEKGWRGYSVFVKAVGTIRPVTAAAANRALTILFVG